MKSGFLERIRRTIARFGLLSPGDKVVVAVSGGPDSVCLLKVLSLLLKEFHLTLSVAHINHGLRGEEAERDEVFVRELCQDMKIPIDVVSVNILSIPRNGRSIEEICREERYRCLNEIMRRRRFGKIAIGHHADDRVETILVNLLRGSGSEGLKGFLPFRDEIYIRPLFDVKHQEILDYLDETHTTYIVDSTNIEKVYLRNRIRHDLIPKLSQDYNPNICTNFIRLSEILRDEDDFLDGYVESLLTGWGDHDGCQDYRIPIHDLMSRHPAIQRRIIKALLERYADGGKGIGFKHVAAALDLASAENPSGVIDLASSVRVSRQYGYLIISSTGRQHGRPPRIAEIKRFKYAVTVPGTVDISELEMRIRFQLVDKPDFDDRHSTYMDYRNLDLPLLLRNIEPGDRIQPLGMIGRKKISDLFTDMKVPKFKRQYIPVLADGKEILWVVGIKMGEKAKVTPSSTVCLKADII